MCVPDEGSGEGLVLPHTTPHGAVTLNGHGVNALEADPPAAAHGARGEEGQREGREERKDSGKKKRRQKKRRGKGV